MTWVFTLASGFWTWLMGSPVPPVESPIDAALRKFLLADTAIAAIVGSQVYPLQLPQKAFAQTGDNQPAIVLSRISGVRGHHLRGPEGLRRTRYQVDCWARTYDAATALGALCERRLDSFTGIWSVEDAETRLQVTIFLDVEQDLHEQEIQGGLYRHSADYFLHHRQVSIAA